MAPKKETDKHSGVETTGHEWDGIKELNTPLPRWWLWIFYLTIIWSIGYFLIYPSWPTLSGEGERGGTKGLIEWTQYKKLDAERAEIIQRRGEYLNRFHKANFEEIMKTPELYAFAIAGGKAAFKDNCATCHGTGGAGAKGYPNLNDDDWIWAGDLKGIYQTIKYGVRIHDEGRYSIMPSFAEVLSKGDLLNVTKYVQGLASGDSLTYPDELSTKDLANIPIGAKIYRENCSSCHGYDGKGNREVGAPNLADAIWLKNEDGSTAAIASQIKHPKHGMMPAFINRLDEDTIRQLTIYVHELGGGE